MAVDYPSQVTDTTPTFLVGGDAGSNSLAKAACGTKGLALMASATTADAMTALAAGVTGTALFVSANAAAALTALGAGTIGSAVLATATTQAAQAAIGLGVVNAQAANYTLLPGDNGKTLVITGTRVITVNTGLGATFGCVILGTVSFTGSATVTDNRVAGASNPACVVVCVGTDTFQAIGSTA